MNENATGDCYESALRHLVDSQNSETRLVHGIVTPIAGPLKDVPHGHAWIEFKDVVYDDANGKDLVIGKLEYYALGQIEVLAVYDKKQACKEALVSMHSGPWSEDYWKLRKEGKVK